MMLAVDGIHTFYGPSHVLHGVSLTIDEGHVVAVIGRNGMGKTTLIRSVAGLTPPQLGIRAAGEAAGDDLKAQHVGRRAGANPRPRLQRNAVDVDDPRQ